MSDRISTPITERSDRVAIPMAGARDNYQLAVLTGFVGTLADWIAWLKGEAATIEITETQTGAAGTQATMNEAVGSTPQHRRYVLVVPRGDAGVISASSPLSFDPVTGALSIDLPAEADPVFEAWKAATPPAYPADVSEAVGAISLESLGAGSAATHAATDFALAANNTGSNTGDETDTTIKTKLGITVLSGSNTGDQTLSSLGAGSAATYSVGATAGTIPVLGSSGKLNIATIPDSLIGQVRYQSAWNASTNTPALGAAPTSDQAGFYWICSVGATFQGIAFEVGDWIIDNAGAWGKIDNTDAVTMVAGRTGAITLDAADIGRLVFTALKTLTLTNSLTFSGTDGSALDIGAGGTLGTAAFTASSAYATTAQGTDARTPTDTGLAATTHAATSKTTPVDADETNIVDSAASNGLKKVTWANIKTTLKTYFDLIYASILGYQTASFTAVKFGQYNVKGSVAKDASVAVADPTSPAPAEGDSYNLQIISGWVRVGGLDYTASCLLLIRSYTGGAWVTLPTNSTGTLTVGTGTWDGANVTGVQTFGSNIVGNGTANRLPNQLAGTGDAAMTRDLGDIRYGIGPRRTRPKIYENEFWGAVPANGAYGTAGEFTMAVLSGGAVMTTAGSSNHPGVWLLRDSTTAGGGYYISSFLSALELAGGEFYSIVFQLNSARTTQTIRMGFFNSLSSTAPTSGVWLEIVGNGSTGGTGTGYATGASGTTTTATTATIASSIWYSCSISLNSAASIATFTVYNEDGSTLWTNTISTNIPGAGRPTGVGLFALESTTDAAANMMSVDHMLISINRDLVR